MKSLLALPLVIAFAGFAIAEAFAQANNGELRLTVVDAIDFGGLFWGNAIGPSRSFTLQLTTRF